MEKRYIDVHTTFNNEEYEKLQKLAKKLSDKYSVKEFQFKFSMAEVIRFCVSHMLEVEDIE